MLKESTRRCLELDLIEGNTLFPVKVFSKEEFKYDEDQNEYICPEGKRLRYYGANFGNERKKDYKAEGGECRACRHFGICMKSRAGHGELFG